MFYGVIWKPQLAFCRLFLLIKGTVSLVSSKVKVGMIVKDSCGSDLFTLLKVLRTKHFMFQRTLTIDLIWLFNSANFKLLTRLPKKLIVKTSGSLSVTLRSHLGM
jgi:hypothetical protein